MTSESCDEVRAAYPDAEFMPWDEPTIGQRVWWAGATDDARKYGRVLGRIEAWELRKERPHCTTCTCERGPEAPGLAGWWRVEGDEPFVIWPESAARKHVFLLYPPQLHRAAP